MITSHVAFIPAIGISLLREAPLIELAVLQSATFGSSILYHRQYERAGTVATVEGALAKALFIYGTMQTWHSPSEALLLGNSMCCVLTIATYVATNAKRPLYETWHPVGLHVVPGVWSTLVASGHSPLLPPLS